MFKPINAFLIFGLMTSNSYVYADKYSNIGRVATKQELVAWDIDVRPDFKGLPIGSGSVAMGQQVWEGKCASCHGTFGESNEVFTPIVGGTIKEDVISGQVSALRNNKQPQKTTMMKVATLSTLWDYIHRAMPWTSPKSLSHDEVFAVVAYILNLSEIIPDDFILSDKNISEVQKLMPNRNGMTFNHGMWELNGKPDVKSVACMNDCSTKVQIRSTLPDLARNVHGNIQQQNRIFGAVRGVDTSKEAMSTSDSSSSKSEQFLQNQSSKEKPANQNDQDNSYMLSLAKKNNCLICHGVNNKIIGPKFTEVKDKYKSDSLSKFYLFEKISKGGGGVWGVTSMPAQTQISNDDLKLLVDWILK